MSTSHIFCTILKDLSTRKLKIEVNSWDTAIAKAKLRIKELEIAIQVFEFQKELGVQWEEAGTDEESAPA